MKKFAIGFGVTMIIFAGLAGLFAGSYFVIHFCAALAESIGLPEIGGAVFGLALWLSLMVGILYSAPAAK